MLILPTSNPTFRNRKAWGLVRESHVRQSDLQETSAQSEILPSRNIWGQAIGMQWYMRNHGEVREAPNEEGVHRLPQVLLGNAVEWWSTGKHVWRQTSPNQATESWYWQCEKEQWSWKSELKAEESKRPSTKQLNWICSPCTRPQSHPAAASDPTANHHATKQLECSQQLRHQSWWLHNWGWR